MVDSWTGPESSLAMTRAYSTIPASIIAAAMSMPLTKPRQALVTSKFWQDGGSPRASWITTAVDGSSQRRLSEVLTIRPTSASGTPAASSAACPAATAPSMKDSVSDHRRCCWMPTRVCSTPPRIRVRS